MGTRREIPMQSSNKGNTWTIMPPLRIASSSYGPVVELEVAQAGTAAAAVAETLTVAAEARQP